jgi:hypothetical protein
MWRCILCAVVVVVVVVVPIVVVVVVCAKCIGSYVSFSWFSYGVNGSALLVPVLLVIPIYWWYPFSGDTHSGRMFFQCFFTCCFYGLNLLLTLFLPSCCFKPHAVVRMHLDTRNLVTRYVNCQEHTPVTLLPLRTSLVQPQKRSGKTLWKETVLSGTLLLVAQSIANHFNDYALPIVLVTQGYRQ